VHILASLPPNLDLSRFVNNVKTTSSRLIRRDFGRELRVVYRKPVFWSRSYCIITCGGAPLSVLKQYVEQQDNPALGRGTAFTPSLALRAQAGALAARLVAT